MPSESIERRRILKTGAAALVGVSGCLSESPSATATTESPQSSSTTTETRTNTTASTETPDVASLSVSDYILYPLAGTHPHVHRHADTQYVVVRLETSQSARAVREALTLTLDGTTVSLADRQPVPWESETVDVAFAVPKTETFEGGTVSFAETTLRSLSDATIDRLNNPPVFVVSNPSVSPAKVHADERVSATVEFDLANTGSGAGTFGASLKGNFVSGSATITATLDSDEEQTVTASTELVGEGEEATVRLDWGSDEWTASVPVVEPTTETTESVTAANGLSID